MLKDWLNDAITQTGISQAEMARQLTARLGRSIDRAAVNKMTKGDRKIAGDEMLAIELITGVPAPAAGPGSEVQISGLIGAGGSVDSSLSQAYGDGVTLVTLDIPLPAGTSAWEVWGPSMLPRYDPGDVIIVQRDADPVDLLLGQIALVVTTDGRRMLKRILRGSKPGLYDLESFNAPTLKDEKISRAAAIYVIVPASQVRRRQVETEIARRFQQESA